MQNGEASSGWFSALGCFLFFFFFTGLHQLRLTHQKTVPITGVKAPQSCCNICPLSHDKLPFKFFNPVTQQKVNGHCEPPVFRFVLPLNMGKGYVPTLSISKRTVSTLFEEGGRCCVYFIKNTWSSGCIHTGCPSWGFFMAAIPTKMLVRTGAVHKIYWV